MSTLSEQYLLATLDLDSLQIRVNRKVAAAVVMLSLGEHVDGQGRKIRYPVGNTVKARLNVGYSDDVKTYQDTLYVEYEEEAYHSNESLCFPVKYLDMSSEEIAVDWTKRTAESRQRMRRFVQERDLQGLLELAEAYPDIVNKDTVLRRLRDLAEGTDNG